MEMYSSLFNIVSLLLFFSSLVIILVSRNKKQTRLPPGPWRLPFLGSLHHLFGRTTPHRTLRNLAQKYGPIMYLQLGEVPMVVISSPAIAKQVLKTHDLAFANRPESTSTAIIFHNKKDIVFCPYDNYWRQMRKTSMVQLFSAKMVKSFSTIRKDELSNIIASIRNSMSMAGTSTVINMTQRIYWFTSSIIYKSVFGLVSEDQDKFIANVKEALLLSGGFDAADLFPSWKLLHKMSSVKSKLVNAHGKVDAIIEDILKKYTENGNKGNEKLVDVLLGIKENSTQLQCPITNYDVKAVLFGIVAAGSETSSAIIIWALSEMMKNPNIMAKAQHEVRQVFQGKKNYDEGDLEKLTYLKLVIKETLRLYPSVSLVPRECREQIDIEGYTIPHKTKVLVNVWALGRDPGSWDDPETFVPERFENSSIDFMENHFEFIPFGAGRRSCPGMLFGLANIELALAQLLHHFEWELPYGTSPQDLDMTETSGLSTTKQQDLYLVAKDCKNDKEY